MEKKQRHIGIRILQVLLVLFGVFATVCGIAVPVILIAAIPYDIIVGWGISRMNRNLREGHGAFFVDKEAKALKQAERAEQLRTKLETSFYAKNPVEARHVSGLPLTPGAPCSIHSEQGLYRIESGGGQFTLDKSKVVDVSTKTEEEIQKQYVSSIGRAALGGAMFGVMGIIVGGMAQKKTVSRTKTNYLFITYHADSALDCIGLEEVKGSLGGNRQDFATLASEFKPGAGFAQPYVQEL